MVGSISMNGEGHMNKNLAELLGQSKYVTSAVIDGEQIVIICQCGEKYESSNQLMAKLFVKSHDELHNKFELLPEPEPEPEKPEETEIQFLKKIR